MKNGIEKFLERIHAEHIAIVLSLLYVIGVVLLLLYNSIVFGDIDFDFIRVKPIVVGCEYILYLALPVLVVFLPVIWASRRSIGGFWIWYYSGNRTNKVSRCRKLCGVCLQGAICLLGIALLAFIVGLMFHYFFPYVEFMLPEQYRLPNGVSLPAAFMISLAFWQVYCCLDVSLIGFACLFIAASLWTLKYCGHLSMSNRRHYIICFGLLSFAFFTNMFYFIRDVYPNISQAAGGGAPVHGIITIDSAGEEFRRCADGSLEDGDVTKLCCVVQTSADFWYIDEQQVFDRGATGGSLAALRGKPTRIRKTDIKQFTPLIVPMFYQYGSRTVFVQDLLYDYIHNLDMFIEIEFVAPTHKQAIKDLWLFNTTNSISAMGSLENFPTFRAHATSQRIIKDGPNSLNYNIAFQHLPIPTMSRVPELFMAITNQAESLVLEVRNLPSIPNDLVAKEVSLGFVINYAGSFVSYRSNLKKYASNIVISRNALHGDIPDAEQINEESSQVVAPKAQ